MAFLTLVWGYNWVVMKEVLAYVDPFDFSAMRTGTGAAVLFGILLWRRRPLQLVAAREVLLLGLLQTTAFTALIQWALVAGGAGKTAVLAYTMPLWLLPLARATLGERPHRVQWLAVGLAAVGLGFVFAPGAGQGQMFSNLLGVGAGLAWALSVVVAKRLRSRHAVDLLSLTAWQMLFGATALAVIAWLLPSRPIAPTPYFFAALAFSAVLATGIAWLLWLYVLQNLSAGMAGMSSLGIPLVGLLGGWIELGERPGPSEMTGMVLIALALAGLGGWSLRAARQASALRRTP